MPNNGFQARESVEEDTFTNCTPVTISGSVAGVRVGVVARDFIVPLASEGRGREEEERGAVSWTRRLVARRLDARRLDARRLFRRQKTRRTPDD